MSDFAFQHPVCFTVLALPVVVGAVAVFLGVCGVSFRVHR